MRAFFAYLRGRRIVLLPAVFVLVFTLVLALFALPLGALLYAALLCAAVYLPLLLADFSRHERRRQLYLRQDAASVSADSLPASLDGVEDALQALLLDALASREAASSETEARCSERIGYYTIWAHQIKTPIAAMRLMLAGRDDADARALASELSRVERYVEMAMCYLRLDGSATDYVFARVPLEPLVRGCARKFAPQFIAKRLRLRVDPLPGEALTDEKWLAFVLEQLLSNAVKYTPAGGEVHIGLDAPMTLCVEDTGIGIAKEDIPRIFDQGFTGLNGRADKRASGIGLYLCGRVCKNLGHTLRCQSEVGRGTRMEIGLSSRALEKE